MDYVFQTKNKLFFVMRFVRGGELFTHLRKARKFTESRTKFYAYQVAMALGHLHKQNIVYRDLKPENILFDEDGYIALTDFGLAKTLKEDELAQSFCGTPDYLAPEIIQEVGHSFPVDWWALGILTYEMIIGFPPFHTGPGQSNDKMYQLIKTKEPVFPDGKRHGIHLSDDCVDFIKKCLAKDPTQRIGSTKGVEEIFKHPWFKGFEPAKMYSKKYKPEFVPQLSKDKLDVSNFDRMFTKEEAVISVLPTQSKETKVIEKNAKKFDVFDS
jgi:serum/glucocorticoid-regulated kinase 2